MTQTKKMRYLVYCRKSTDSEDRQVQSIQDQREHLEKLKHERGLKVIKLFEESMSAKKAGRPIFNEMLQMIEKGEAEGIICWKLNRLARNPIDGGRIQWLLQEGIIKSISTPGREYLPEDNTLMMAVEFGMANQFVLDLSKDVKRGMAQKVKKGWRPLRAPLGYTNDKLGEKGNKKIFSDPQKFDLVRKCWDWFLTGAYSVPMIAQKAHDELGLRGYTGKQLSDSTYYKIFTNPFYYGEFVYNGEWCKGAHKTMITESEFDTAQKILGKKGQPRPKYKRLPFTGLIQCKECGGMITADEKIKTYKRTGNTAKYLYHRCTKRKKGQKCYQKPVTHQNLVEQIHEHLDSITIPQEFLKWAVDVLKENNELEENSRSKIIDLQRKNYDNCLKRIDNLINLYVSPDNTDRELLSENEFKDQKKNLVTEKERIEKELRSAEERVDEWMELTEKTFNFATYAKHWFDKGDYQKKKEILMALGQNFFLEDGRLSIELRQPYLIMRQEFEKNTLLNKARCGLKNNQKLANNRLLASSWSG
jgi:site-specific DNA recombinase